MNLKELLGDKYKEGMTFEEIETALADIQTGNDGSDEIARLKNALSKSNSEAADYKRQLRAKQTEDELKAQEEKEKWETLQAERDTLFQQVQISSHKAKFLSLGYDEKLATETAEALVGGDMEKVFANQQKHQQGIEQKIKADILKSTPQPVGNGEPVAMTKEKFRALSDEERLKFAEERPQEYRQLYSNE